MAEAQSVTEAVAERYTEFSMVDWDLVAGQFAGHTVMSLKRMMYAMLVPNAKKKMNVCGSVVTPRFVADYTDTVYGEGRDQAITPAKEAHRLRLVAYFERRVNIHEIKNFL